jgi:uncharacterized protein with HEPN domain
MEGKPMKAAVEELLTSTDLLATLLDENDIEFEDFDASEFLRDTIPAQVESIVDETAQRVYRRMRDEFLNVDPNNASRMRAYYDGLVDPDFDELVRDNYLDF